MSFEGKYNVKSPGNIFYLIYKPHYFIFIFSTFLQKYQSINQIIRSFVYLFIFILKYFSHRSIRTYVIKIISSSPPPPPRSFLILQLRVYLPIYPRIISLYRFFFHQHISTIFVQKKKKKTRNPSYHFAGSYAQFL